MENEKIELQIVFVACKGNNLRFSGISMNLKTK